MSSAVIRQVLNLRVSLTVLFFISIVTSQLAMMIRTDATPFFDQYSVSSGHLNPQDIVTSPGTGGSMWFTDYNSSTGNSEIGNITTSGTITDYNVVPSGYVSVKNVGGVVMGPDGNVWFSACGWAPSGSRDVMLEKLDVSTGAITAVPYNIGNMCGTSVMPGPLTVDQNGYIWVAMRDMTGFFGNQLTRFDTTGSTTYYWTHSGDNWSSISAGPGNTLWLTDVKNNQLDKITLTSTSSAISATTSYTVPTSSSNPMGITAGPDGNMWFGESSAHKIARVTPSGTFTEYATPSGSGPNALITGPDGALWFTSNGLLAKVGRVTTSGSITEYSVPGSGNSPFGITAGPDNALWFTDLGTEQVGRISATPFFDQYSVSSGHLNPQDIVTSPGTGGSMWFTDYNSSTGNSEIGNITTSGTITDYNVVPSGYVSVKNVGGVVMGPDGNVWFSACGWAPSGSRDVMLEKLDVSTGAITAVPYNIGNMCGTSVMPGPLTVDQNGYIWVAMRDMTGFFGNQLTRFDTTGSTTYYWTHSGDNWSSISAGPGNTLWLTDVKNNQLDKITLTSTSSAISATTSYTVPTSSSNPMGITAGPDGNMWFGESSAHKIARVTPSGTFTEYATPSGSGPNALITGPDGALWFTSNGLLAKVGRVTTSGSITEYSVPGSGNSPFGITAGPDNALWFTDLGTEQVGRLGY